MLALLTAMDSLDEWSIYYVAVEKIVSNVDKMRSRLLSLQARGNRVLCNCTFTNIFYFKKNYWSW